MEVAERASVVRRELEAGRQAYVIYPLVEESEKVDLKAATAMAEELQRDVFTDYKVALLHGRLKPDEKDRVMAAFARGEVHVLVSTTVVEVGVDVPAATVMVIEHAERFGLAQLHQSDGVVEFALKSRQRSETVFKVGALAHDLLRGFGVVPEVGVFDLRVQFGEAAEGHRSSYFAKSTRAIRPSFTV